VNDIKGCIIIFSVLLLSACHHRVPRPGGVVYSTKSGVADIYPGKKED
jgi:hypothetical protein